MQDRERPLTLPTPSPICQNWLQSLLQSSLLPPRHATMVRNVQGKVLGQHGLEITGLSCFYLSDFWSHSKQCSGLTLRWMTSNWLEEPPILRNKFDSCHSAHCALIGTLETSRLHYMSNSSSSSNVTQASPPPLCLTLN